MMKKRLPAWALGIANMPLGLTCGIELLTVPQILAARHVPEVAIAQMTTIALIPTFGVFLLGPLLDTHFSRRTYAVASTLLAALAVAVTVLALDNLVVLGVAMFLAIAAGAANNAVIGGWFGNLLDSEAEDATLGAWFNVANTFGYGLISCAAIFLIRGAPSWLAAMLLAAPALVPLAIYAVTPAPPPDEKLAGESFAQFWSDLRGLISRPIVLRTLLLFVAPITCFALTNTLGGLGRDYGTDEGLVAVFAGVSVIGGGLVGSLLVPPLARRMSGPQLYLCIGGFGALFTLSTIVMPHSPAVYFIAMFGANVGQAAGLSTISVIALNSLGKDNPFAATQFALLICAGALPITYMQLVDGHAYGLGGLKLMYLADGGLGLIACTLLAALWFLWSRSAARVSAIAA